MPYGGDSSAVQDQLTGIQQIACTAGAFAALRSDGRVVTWGQADCGGQRHVCHCSLSFRFLLLMSIGA